MGDYTSPGTLTIHVTLQLLWNYKSQQPLTENLLEIED